MADYKLSNQAKNDLIRVHQFGVKQFGEKQADLYFDTLFECIDVIALRPFAFEDVSYKNLAIEGVFVDLIQFFIV